MSLEFEVNTRKITIVACIVAIVIFSAVFIMASIKIVDAGHRGVLTHWNAVDFSRPPLSSGLHFVIPFQDNIIPANIQVQAQIEKASSASKDLQIVTTQVTVNYHPDPNAVHTLYQEVGFNFGTKIINPIVQEVVKAVTANYNAEELITERPNVKLEIEEAIKSRMAQFDLLTDQVSITDFDFSPEFNVAIEAKVTAQQNALAEEKKIKIKEAQAQQAIAEAYGVAQSMIARAEGEKQAKILQAEGEGKAIEIINEFLAKNPQYLEWLKTNRWDGKLPGTLVTGEGNAIPFINIPAGEHKNEP